jgi:hypothetical protein
MGRKLNSIGLRLGYNTNWLNTNIKHNYDRVFQNYLYINNFMSNTLKRNASVKKRASARILRSTNELTTLSNINNFKKLKLKQYIFKKSSWKKRAYNYNSNLFNPLLKKKKTTWILNNLNYLKWSLKEYKFYKNFNTNTVLDDSVSYDILFTDDNILVKNFKFKKSGFLKYQESLSKKIKNIIFFKKYYKYTYKSLIWVNRLIKDSFIFSLFETQLKNTGTLNLGTKLFQHIYGWGELKPLRGRDRNKLYHFSLKAHKRPIKNLSIFLNIKTNFWQEKFHVTGNFYKDKLFTINTAIMDPIKIAPVLKLIDIKRRLANIYYKRFFETKFKTDLKRNINVNIKNYNLGDEVALLWWNLIVLKRTPEFSQQWLRVPGGFKIFKIFLSAFYFKSPVLIGEYLVKGLERSRNPAQFLQKFEGTLKGFMTWWLVYGIKYFGKVFHTHYIDTLKPEIQDLILKSPLIKGDFVYNITIAIKGRWSNKKEETKQKWISVGEKTDFQTIDSKINFYQTTAVTRRGSFGIKIWFSSN